MTYTNQKNLRSDTSWNTLVGFVKAMVLFPEVQKRAQAEIDLLVGSDRMPTWEDRDSLPYIRGCVEETLRCGYMINWFWRVY